MTYMHILSTPNAEIQNFNGKNAFDKVNLTYIPGKNIYVFVYVRMNILSTQTKLLKVLRAKSSEQ